jgi:hypothetical protein
VNPDGSTEAQIPEEHNGQKSEQDEKGKFNRKMEKENTQAYQTQAEEADEYIGDKHGPIIESKFWFKFLATDGTFFWHFKGMLDLHFLKQLALAAAWTGHPEDTGESAHAAKIVSSLQ